MDTQKRCDIVRPMLGPGRDLMNEIHLLRQNLDLPCLQRPLMVVYSTNTNSRQQKSHRVVITYFRK
jgi:hypothetical protein